MDIYRNGMSVKRIALINVDNIKDVLKREITLYMKENDLSQYGVGKICDLPTPYINQVLGPEEKPVSIAKLCQIATAIGIKLTLLIEKK